MALGVLVGLLALVVGMLFLIGRWMKGSGFRSSRSLPIEAFELLGRRVLEPRITVHVVKFGGRVLLLGVGPDSARTLSEVDDPEEVKRLVSACRASKSGTAFGQGAPMSSDTFPDVETSTAPQIDQPIPPRETGRKPVIPIGMASSGELRGLEATSPSPKTCDPWF